MYEAADRIQSPRGRRLPELRSGDVREGKKEFLHTVESANSGLVGRGAMEVEAYLGFRRQADRRPFDFRCDFSLPGCAARQFG